MQSVTERELPEVDDDFAQLASEFDTVEELRADLAEKIRRVKNRSQGAEARDKVLEALLEATEIPAPESIVEAEFDVREHDAVHSFDHDEAAFSAHLESEGQTREEFDAEIARAPPRSRAPSCCWTRWPRPTRSGSPRRSSPSGSSTTPSGSASPRTSTSSACRRSNQLGAVFAEVRRGKALAGAVEQATVTDASGNVLDVAALFGVEEIDEADEAAEELVAEIAEDRRGRARRRLIETRSKRPSTRRSSRTLDEATGEELAVEDSGAARRSTRTVARRRRRGEHPERPELTGVRAGHRQVAGAAAAGPVTPSANSGPPGHRPDLPVVTVG